MKTLTTIVIALALSTGTALAQVLPQPKSGSLGGSCPHGYFSSGAFCMPSQGAQGAVPLPLNGSCPWGWTRSGSYCVRGVAQQKPSGPPMTLGNMRALGVSPLPKGGPRR